MLRLQALESKLSVLSAPTVQSHGSHVLLWSCRPQCACNFAESPNPTAQRQPPSLTKFFAAPVPLWCSYIHANMDESGLPSGKYNLVTVQFVMHECPAAITANLVSWGLWTYLRGLVSVA